MIVNEDIVKFLSGFVSSDYTLYGGVW